MSYARWSEDSDVYVYHSDGYVCQCCTLVKQACLPDKREPQHLNYADVQLDKPQEMLDHLILHRLFGHQVPQDALDRLVEDVKAGGYRLP